MMMVPLLLVSSPGFASALLAIHRRRHRIVAVRPSRRAARSTLRASTGSDVGSMRVSEMREELKELGVDYSDCFDKESLMVRLQEAREGKVRPKAKAASPRPSETTREEEVPAATLVGKEIDEDEKAAMLQELRAMKVRELREALASRNIRWAGLLEKEDLVQAVLKARLEAARFSATGKIAPGRVADLTADQVRRELRASSLSTPMLLDVYAVWCGPCQLMAGQLKDAAADLGDRIRMAKMDSDKYPELSSELKVQGLPSLILFDESGNELDRIEGALMKDQLIEWIESKIR
jgi:thiol-disulfide isomerase/thioredoxin